MTSCHSSRVGCLTGSFNSRQCGDPGCRPFRESLVEKRCDSHESSLLFKADLPAGVKRYFCNRLFGFSGIVYSMNPFPMSSRMTLLSWPDTFFCPSRVDSSALLSEFCAIILITRQSSDSSRDSGWIDIFDATTAVTGSPEAAQDTFPSYPERGSCHSSERFQSSVPRCEVASSSTQSSSV